MSGAYDWVLFTSVNTAHVVEARLRAVGADSWSAASCRVAAVGRATAEAVERAIGRAPDLVPAPDEQHAAALAAALPIEGGERVLLPASSQARPELTEALRARGALVTVITVYDTVAASPDTDIRSLLGSADAFIFASPSAVTAFAERLAASRLGPEALGGLIIACIGPTTLAAARGQQFPNPLMAREQSLTGIIQLLKTTFATSSEQEAIHAQ
jgi:uroporphyrinogen III methyltransferase/synthase